MSPGWVGPVFLGGTFLGGTFLGDGALASNGFTSPHRVTALPGPTVLSGRAVYFFFVCDYAAWAWGNASLNKSGAV